MSSESIADGESSSWSSEAEDQDQERSRGNTRDGTEPPTSSGTHESQGGARKASAGGMFFAIESQGLGLQSQWKTRSHLGGHLSLLRRLHLHKELSGHEGCVNTCSFSQDGNFVITGSDDRLIKLYDWAKGECALTVETLHSGNVFQAKQLPHCEHIVSCAADGQVHIHYLARNGCGKPVKQGDATSSSTVLGSHTGRAHKLSLNPFDPNSFLSCGEDGIAYAYDVRTNETRVAVRFLDFSGHRAPLNSVIHDPRSMGHRFALAGGDKYIKVYDSRFIRVSDPKPVFYFAASKVSNTTYITCLDYSCQGELLATYSEDNVYLFDPASQRALSDANGSCALSDSELLRFMSTQAAREYKGHRNCETVKGVSFLGPNSDYVASGSDCGNIFIWDKDSTKLLTCLQGDAQIVNCVEPHPHLHMTLATSGLEHNCKIWQPTASAETVPGDMDDLVDRNLKELEANSFQSEFRTILYTLMVDNHPLMGVEDSAEPRESREDGSEPGPFTHVPRLFHREDTDDDDMYLSDSM